MNRARKLLFVATICWVTGLATAEVVKTASPVLTLVNEGSVIELEPEREVDLAAQVVAYFETCRPYERVMRERPDQDDLRRVWEEQKRGFYAIVTVPADGTDGSAEAARLVLIGLSGSGAGHVLSHDRDNGFVLYSKCDGLGGAVLECDIRELIPPGEVTVDCGRLREIKRQAGARRPAARSDR